MSKNPNAAGVLFVGLGCEINAPTSLKPSLGVLVPTRIHFIACQAVEDEFEESLKFLRELPAHTLTDQRERVPISKGIVGSNGAVGLSGRRNLP
jgi:altronate hydrolase